VHDSLRASPIEFPNLTNVTFATVLDELARRLQAGWDWYPVNRADSESFVAEAAVFPLGPNVELEYRMPVSVR
jgi:hypothetical protein